MVIKEDFFYWPTNDMRCLHIYLPEGYAVNEERYPVMYMFDGHNLFHDEDATYGKSWGLESFLDHWDKPVIVVGMECSHRGNERLWEYCPYEKKVFGEMIHGIGEQTFQWIIHDVKPYIDSCYLTYGHREATGIAGSSMGGIMAMYGILAHNNVFSKSACISSGVFWNLSKYRQSLDNALILPDTRIYISWGEKEVSKPARNGNPEFDSKEARSVFKFERELQERGITTWHYFQRDGKHCEEDWEKQNAIYMNFLWK